VLDPWQILVAVSKDVNLITFFRQLPFKINAELWAYKDPIWRHSYNNPLFIFLGFFAFLLILSPLILKKEHKNTLFFSLLLVIGLFLCLGLNPPFGNIFEYLFKNIPYFGMFRNPSNKFLPFLIVPYTILFGVGVNSLYRYVKYKYNSVRLARAVLIMVLFLICGLYVYPMWTGSVVSTPITIHGNEISPFVEVPSYYEDIANYFRKDLTDYRILSLPLRPFDHVMFNWKYGYEGSDTAWLLYEHSTISCLLKNYYPSAKILSKLDENLDELHKIASLFSIKYVVIQNDVDIIHGNYGGRELSSQEELRTQLEELGTPFIRSFGKLDLYKIPDEYFLPHIYPASMSILIDGSIDEMTKFVTLKYYKAGNNAIFLSNQTNKEQWQFLRGYNNTLLIDSIKKPVNVVVYNGWEKPFSWESLNNSSVEARYYTGWKNVVNIGGLKEDTLSFPTLNTCPYEFPSYSPDKWDAYMSTLIYIKTGLTPLEINEILENGTPIKDIIGIWWETGWTGMGKPIKFPVTIPPNQKAIIQINHIIEGNVTLCVLDTMNLTKLGEVKVFPVITFKKINPTKYVVKVENSTEPFFLVFSESYHPQWKVYIEDKSIKFDEIIAEYPHVNVKEARHNWYKFTPEDITFLLKKPQDERYHFVANGYANAWYIDPKDFDKDGDGEFVVILYFLPQSLFYLGLFISGVTLFVCVGYLFHDWMRERRKLN